MQSEMIFPFWILTSVSWILFLFCVYLRPNNFWNLR